MFKHFFFSITPRPIHENGHSIQATGVLHGRSVVITAGPTREAIDPVRYLSNYSSGKMGFALAAAAAKAGASVTLVAGPCQLATPAHVTRVDVVFSVGYAAGG